MGRKQRYSSSLIKEKTRKYNGVIILSTQPNPDRFLETMLTTPNPYGSPQKNSPRKTSQPTNMIA